MSEITEPGQDPQRPRYAPPRPGPPTAGIAIPARLGREPETAAFRARQTQAEGGPDDGVPGTSPSLAVAECLHPVTEG
jgi:hypothetical protein